MACTCARLLCKIFPSFAFQRQPRPRKFNRGFTDASSALAPVYCVSWHDVASKLLEGTGNLAIFDGLVSLVLKPETLNMLNDQMMLKGFSEPKKQQFIIYGDSSGPLKLFEVITPHKPWKFSMYSLYLQHVSKSAFFQACLLRFPSQQSEPPGSLT